MHKKVMNIMISKKTISFKLTDFESPKLTICVFYLMIKWNKHQSRDKKEMSRLY